MSRVPRTSKTRRLAALALASLAATPFVAAPPALADTIQVVVDQAKVMRVSRPADIVIIGNPAIADATIQDNQTLIITGHSYGTTNLIVLDASGQAVADELVSVGPQNDQVVTIYRRGGDSPSVFDPINGQIQSHSSLSSSAAEK